MLIEWFSFDSFGIVLNVIVTSSNNHLFTNFLQVWVRVRVVPPRLQGSIPYWRRPATRWVWQPHRRLCRISGSIWPPCHTNVPIWLTAKRWLWLLMHIAVIKSRLVVYINQCSPTHKELCGFLNRVNIALALRYVSQNSISWRIWLPCHTNIPVWLTTRQGLSLLIKN